MNLAVLHKPPNINLNKCRRELFPIIQKALFSIGLLLGAHIRDLKGSLPQLVSFEYFGESTLSSLALNVFYFDFPVRILLCFSFVFFVLLMTVLATWYVHVCFRYAMTFP